MFPFRSYFSGIRAMRMRIKDRDAAFRKVSVFMDTHPVPEYLPIREVSVSFRVKLLFKSLRHVTAFACVLLLATGGTTAVLAEQALPGDSLYTYKVEFVEELIEMVLSVSPNAETEWQVKRVERRLQDSIHSALDGQLDEKSAVLLVQRMEDYALNVHNDITELVDHGEVADAADAALELETSLDGYHTLLEQVSEDLPDSSSILSTMDFFIAEVIETHDEAMEVRTMLEADVATLVESDPELVGEQIVEAEAVISEVAEALEDTTTDMEEGMLREVKLSMQNARSFLAESGRKLRLGQQSEAFEAAQHASAEAEGIQELLEAHEVFDGEL